MLFDSVFSEDKEKEQEQDKDKAQEQDKDSGLSDSQLAAFNVVTRERQNVLITGPAGTGKTFLIKEIVRRFEEMDVSVLVTATTGVAATNNGGITLHSFGGIGLGSEKR